MNTTTFRIAAAGLFFVLIFTFGFWLSRSGKPYNLALFTLHKLATLGAIVFLGVTVYQIHRAAPLGPAQLIAAAVAALCFLALMATGGLLSVDKPFPVFVLKLHQVIPYLALLSTASLLYLLSKAVNTYYG